MATLAQRFLTEVNTLSTSLCSVSTSFAVCAVESSSDSMVTATHGVLGGLFKISTALSESFIFLFFTGSLKLNLCCSSPD